MPEYTTSETRMVRKHEDTSYEYIRGIVLISACVIGSLQDDAGRQMTS